MTYFIIGLVIGFVIAYFIADYFWPTETPLPRPDVNSRARLVAAEVKIGRLEAELSNALSLRDRLAAAELEVAQLESLLAIATARRPAGRFEARVPALFDHGGQTHRSPAW